MSAHTPGPWTVSRGASDDYHFNACGSDGTPGNGGWFLAINCGLGPNCRDASYPAEAEEEYQANVRLVAAAPDLLDALKAMTDRWEPGCPGKDRVMWENARAAIAKATAP